jgi:hypothetical protein
MRVRTWWQMVSVFAAALLVRRTVSILFFALLSLLALKEYFTLIPTRRVDRRVLFWASLAIPFQYLWVSWEWYGMFLAFIPVFCFLLLPVRMLLNVRHPEGLPCSGPALVVANHNSHLDVLVLLSMFPLRSGVAHLLQRHPQLAATPVFLHGLGKALPRGEALLVPFFCDVVVGEGLQWCGDRRGCLAELESGLTTLAAELDRPEWS